MGLLGAPCFNVCIDAITSIMTSQYYIPHDTGKRLFGDKAIIKSAFVLCFLDCKIQSKIIRYKFETVE